MISSTRGTSRSREDERVVEPHSQVVDVEEADAGDVPGAPLDIRGNRQVHDDERPSFPLGHRATHGLGKDDGSLGGGCRHGDVGPRENVLQLVQAVCGRARALRDFDRALARAVRHPDLNDATTRPGP